MLDIVLIFGTRPVSSIAGLFVFIMSFQLVNFVEENKRVQQDPKLFVMSIADERQLHYII